jgi:hypothetical protein
MCKESGQPISLQTPHTTVIVQGLFGAQQGRAFTFIVARKTL